MEHRIKLETFRGKNSSLFTGRPQGEQARDVLKLTEFDQDPEAKVIFEIPKETTSFNPSFFLGLLFESIKKLGIDNFEKKYLFEFLDDHDLTKQVLKENLEDGKRNALNTINHKTGLFKFLN